MTAFAECLRLLKHASRHPIAQGLPHYFRDSAAGFKENSHDVLFNLSERGRQAVNQRIVVMVEALCAHNSIVEFECRQEDSHRAACACGERDQLEPGVVFLQLALETSDREPPKIKD